MPAGRPPVPTQLKILRGNPGRRALPKAEPTPPTGPVKAPSWLRGPGRRAWTELAPLLGEMRVLTPADRQALALLCDAYAEYRAARDVVREQGMTYEAGTIAGGTMVRKRPEVEIAADAWRRVTLMLQQFGLTPSSRTKVQAQPDDRVDPDEELLRGLGG